MKEIWKPIIWFEDLYEVSNLGRVKWLPRFRMTGTWWYISKEKILSERSCWGENKTIQVVLTDLDKEIFRYSVSRLVFESFWRDFDKDSDTRDIIHIDWDYKNNNISNLSPLTRKEITWITIKSWKQFKLKWG